MKAAVVDASVAAKWVVEEQHSAEAALLLAYDALYAPDHWRAEAVNVLWSKVFQGDLTEADARERMAVLMRAPIAETPIATLMPRAFEIAVARMVTVYDALYVALAEQRGVPMVTADERLVRRMAGELVVGVQCITYK
ncbi:MAG TPA: type II toxin-antitoxin system VapC family toxin [Rhodopila sp.]|uniref:type II toxin-antitoxin system VapC family toxin n=1 Tax=Rhodopila sp. TaxID=2480087 RepID=UPI002CDB57D3|nr:type II toxin-antitoxin system VapC family toxin [Rhodopila sp.]HVY17565.1 type II toxin-antitoxin system VapC family toxin [Rhodopila sp.]